jgi:hypothetical protein
LKTYKQGGITELLTVKKAPGNTPHIPPEVRENLIKKLQESEGEKLWQITAMARKKMRD